ncbi:MAG: ABC-2 type transport system permease protein [Parcubacteria group bacterium Gr01-1014_30]|nr:MAG: ABC-2 type transport system permease protein [Parcubacteria group bacterium Gr01-1014_30]
METFFWPFIDVILWGFITVYFTRREGEASSIVLFLLGGLILWNIVWRAQQDIGFALLRNVWSRNILNLFSSPLTPWEFMFATMALGLVKIILTLVVISTIAFVFYSFNIFSLGPYFLPFFISLILFGWASGILINGLVIRFGMRIQAFVWSLIFLLYPVSAVFYPVSVLPDFLQKVAQFLPTAHIFEGMREVLSSGQASPEHLIWAFALNVVYLALAGWFFVFMFEKAREKGKLAKVEM